VPVRDWRAPDRPIAPFRFWLLADPDAHWEFAPAGFRGYRAFVERSSGERVHHDALVRRLLHTEVSILGAYPAIPAANRRRTPGVFWGEIHGMAFNQRPLDDFYDYAETVTELDFCAAMLFSYNTCVGNVWEEVKAAARRHTRPGEFVAFAGFECGTPPDDSHRCVYFPRSENVPPIFCDSRPPAQEPILQSRFHPDTVFCNTLDEFYETVREYGGFVTGHHHTTTYDREVLAEMWQKQRPLVDEEERILRLLRGGKRLGLVGGSDTHDSMPGNPFPEPSCPRRAGLMGVRAAELTIEALTEALLARRVFATSGARVAVRFDSNGRPMGSELAVGMPRTFDVSVDGTAPLDCVELLRDGRPIQNCSPDARRLEAQFEDADAGCAAEHFYLVRVRQADGHTAWTSPIWFGGRMQRGWGGS